MSEQQLQIDKMLVLSTAHLDQPTLKFLEQQEEEMMESNLVVYRKHIYGYIVLVQEERYGVPEVLENILKFCEQHECEWLMLDGDADQIESLPVFDSEEESSKSKCSTMSNEIIEYINNRNTKLYESIMDRAHQIKQDHSDTNDISEETTEEFGQYIQERMDETPYEDHECDWKQIALYYLED